MILSIMFIFLVLSFLKVIDAGIISVLSTLSLRVIYSLEFLLLIFLIAAKLECLLEWILRGT